MARFLALDWDYNHLHVVAATVGGGGVRIQGAAAWQLDKTPNPAEAEDLGKLLRERLQQAGLAPAPVLVCVGRDRVIVKDVRYPVVPAAEEPAVVRFQAAKELTDAAEEVVIDYMPAGDNGGNGDRRAMAVVLRRELLTTYQTLCRAAGLKLLALTPRPLGTAACLHGLLGTTVLTPPPEPPDAAVAVLAVAERWAEFDVVRGDRLLLARALAVPAAGAAGPFIGEIRRNLAVYAGQNPQQPVRAVYLAGGAGGLRERLEETLGIVVYTFDPLLGAELPELPAAGRGGFAGAVGLLQVQAQRRDLPINFVHPKEPKPVHDPNRWRLLAAAALGGLLLTGTAAYSFLQLQAAATRERQTLAIKSGLDQQLVLLEEEAKRIKALSDWSSAEIVWLDELYDLTDRFPDIRNLRLTELTGDPIKRTGKDKDQFVAKMSLKGLTNESKPVDDLVKELGLDTYYRGAIKQLSPNNRGLNRRDFSQQFTSQVEIQKRPPDKYVRRLSVAPPSDSEEPRGRGGFGGFGGRGGRGGPPNQGFGFGEFGGQP